VNARYKFMIGGALILGTVGYLMASGIKDTGQYYLTPTELAAKVQQDHSFYNVGLKIGARVVKGTIQRDEADVVVEGRLASDGTFHATTLLAKCGSRYENAPTDPRLQHPSGVARTNT
jgi:cytochrome c-type biogenesis protein CcmE